MRYVFFWNFFFLSFFFKQIGGSVRWSLRVRVRARHLPRCHGARFHGSAVMALCTDWTVASEVETRREEKKKAVLRLKKGELAAERGV